ncbi:flagellin, partial [Filomicrobium sp.]
MEKSIDVMTDLQKKLVLARQPGADRAKIQTEIDELQNQLRSIASSASFTGENWLDVDTTAGSGYTASEEVVASFSRSGGSVSVSTISIDVSSTFLFNQNGAATADARGILASNRVAATGAIGAAGTIVIASTDGTAEMDISGAAVTDANIDEFITAVDQAMQEMTDAATNLGAAKSRIDLQSEFVSALSDAIDRGISTLVDADMNEESTRMQALQVQQQLGIQALSLANQNSQNILSLFR